VIEAYGHGAGDLPLWASRDVGVEALSVPEKKLEVSEIIELADKARKSGKRSIIILVAEFLYNSQELAHKIGENTGIESKAIIPLQIQRGGSPVEKDKKLASILGKHSVEELLNGKSSITVGVRDWQPMSTDIIEAVELPRANYDQIVEQYNKERGK
jgi:6-phosphofructokinase 1